MVGLVLAGIIRNDTFTIALGRSNVSREFCEEIERRRRTGPIVVGMSLLAIAFAWGIHHLLLVYFGMSVLLPRRSYASMSAHQWLVIASFGFCLVAR